MTYAGTNRGGTTAILTAESLVREDAERLATDLDLQLPPLRGPQQPLEAAPELDEHHEHEQRPQEVRDRCDQLRHGRNGTRAHRRPSRFPDRCGAVPARTERSPVLPDTGCAVTRSRSRPGPRRKGRVPARTPAPAP